MRCMLKTAAACFLVAHAICAAPAFAGSATDFRLERIGGYLSFDWSGGYYDGYEISIYRKINDYPWKMLYSDSDAQKKQQEVVIEYYEDHTSPSIPIIERVDDENRLLYLSAVDFGDTLNFKLEAAVNGKTFLSSEKGVTNISGLKGFVYSIDNFEYSRPGEEAIFLTPETPLFIPEWVEEGDYLHIAAIDNIGNVSVTQHANIYNTLGLDKIVYDELTVIGKGYRFMEPDEILFRQTQYYEKDTEAAITAPEVQGWCVAYDEDKTMDALFGFDREIVFNYRPQLGIASVRGVDVNSGDIIYEKKSTHYIGEKFISEPLDIEGYILTEEHVKKEVTVNDSDNVITFIYEKEMRPSHIIYTEKYITTANGDIFIEGGYSSGRAGELKTVFADDINGRSAFVSKLEDIPVLVYDYSEVYCVNKSSPIITGNAAVFARYGETVKVKQFYKAVYEANKASTVFVNYIVNGKVENVTTGSALAFKTEPCGNIKIDCPSEYNGYSLMSAFEYTDAEGDMVRNYCEIVDGIIDYKTNKNSHMINLVYGSAGLNSKINIICVDDNDNYLLEPQALYNITGNEMQIEPFNIDFYTTYSCYVDGEFISDGICNIIPKKNEHEVVFVYERSINQQYFK